MAPLTRWSYKSICTFTYVALAQDNMFFPGYYHWHLFDLFVMNSRLVEQPANTTTVLFFSFSSFVPQTATLEIDNHLLTCSQLNAKLVPKNKQEVLTPQIQTFTLHVHPSIKLISYWIHCGRENTWNCQASQHLIQPTTKNWGCLSSPDLDERKF